MPCSDCPPAVRRSAFYRELVRLHQNGKADFSRAHTLNLDEFVGLSKDGRSYCAFMEKHLFKRVNIPSRQVHFLDGHAPNLDVECLRYERLIDALGGIDLLLLGVGENGHIGFNEPARALQACTSPRAQRLAHAARTGGCSAAESPRCRGRALSMGMATILESGSIALVAMGRSKARAVESMFTGTVTTQSPVSFLQLHPEVHVLVDSAAAATLSRSLAAPSR